MTARILPRLVVAVRETCLPVGIDNCVVNVLIHLYHLGLPLVKVHRLDLGNMDLELAVLTRTSQANKGTESY